jgi:hypothetical protein
MRQVLWRVYKVEEVRDSDDPDAWGSRWLRFASALPGVGDPPAENDDESDWEDWITQGVESFARLHKMSDHFKREFDLIREASA